MPSIVRIADPTGSTPRPLSLLGVGIGGVVAGLLSIQLSLAAPRPETTASDEPTADDAAHPHEGRTQPGTQAPGSATGTALDDEGAPGAAGVDDPTEGAASDEPVAEAQNDAAAPGDPSPEADPNGAEAPGLGGESQAHADETNTGEDGAGTEGGPARELTRGRVAYFGCPSDRCNRDHSFERDVFRTLERVTGCMGGAGEGDVRVTVEGGAVTDVRFRERGAVGLPIPTLDRCLTPPLRRVTGSVLPNGVVVSFRFDVL
ncbi:MAG: hypothetical protein R3B40_18730 [Polyangiales bacterium]